jgi:hypothetical protein
VTEPVVLREDDPRVPVLLAEGHRVAHRSWGARLRHVDVALLTGLVADAVELGPGSDPGIAALEAAVRDDYPGGPATAPDVHDPAALARLRVGGTRFFGVETAGEVVAVTAIRRDGDHAETDFTAVARAHRRRPRTPPPRARGVGEGGVDPRDAPRGCDVVRHGRR